MGVGLIGGSLGLAIKKRKLAKFAVGVFRRKATLDKALGVGAVDAGTLDLKRGVQGADLVILAGPVSTIVGQIKILGKLLDSKTVVVDVGSSKAVVVQAAKKYLRKNIFVGCHPMAGSEKTGVEFSDSDLFNEAICFQTSGNKKIERFWQSLGGKSVVIDAKTHDAWVAQASHLPHLVSFAMFRHFPKNQKFGINPSIRDLARLSQSDPHLWADILLSNQTQVLLALNNFQKNLSLWNIALRRKNHAEIVRFIQKANEIR